MNKTSKGWTFTSYDIEPPVFDDSWMRCLIYQREKCPSTDREHWQGALIVSNKNGLAFKTVKFKLPGYHLLASKGTWKQNVAYCSKEESRLIPPVIFGDQPQDKESRAKLCRLTPLIEMAMQGKTMKQMLEVDGATYARNYNALDKIAKAYSKQTPGKYKAEDFTEELKTDMVMVFSGKSGVGKTQFALAHFKNPLIVSHTEDLKKLDDTYDGIVFDDMDFLHWPRTAQIHILDSEVDRSINVKNSAVTIPANLKKIFTTNQFSPFNQDDEAIERRFVRHEFNNKIFI